MLDVSNLRLGEYPVYISGESVSGTLDEMTIINATVFFRENAGYTPSIQAKKLTYTSGKFIIADEVSVGLLGGRFIRFPRIEQRLDAIFINYVSARLGYRADLGLFGEASLRLPLAEGFRFGGDFGRFENAFCTVGHTCTRSWLAKF